VKTSLAVVKDRLLKGRIFPGCGEKCRNCQTAENGCDSLRRGIQQLIDEGCLQFDQTRPVKNDVSTVTIYFTPEEIYVPERPAPTTIYFPENSAPIIIYSDNPQPALVSPVTIMVPGPVPYGKIVISRGTMGLISISRGRKLMKKTLTLVAPL
jgi:hypothetical protein